MKHIFALVLLSLSSSVLAQQPEHQISFAREMRPHAYYVKQAELWWKQLEKDSLSEDNWSNYFRACRNAQGTDDWKTDFTNESPYLRTGDDIVKMMSERIPNTATYLYLSYLNYGVGTENGGNLLKAYRMKPDLEGIHSSVVSYAVSSLNDSLRHEVNRAWYKINYLSPNLLTYGYNVLMSLEPNAILLTQNDNDTYPLWMLQDALGIRPDVKVINIDFLLMDNYRSAIFAQLGIPRLDLGEIDQNVYRNNWSRIVRHILETYSGSQPLYVGMTLYEDLYENFAKRLALSGLAFKLTKRKTDLTKYNRTLFEKKFLLDSIAHSFFVDQNEGNVVAQQMNYLNMFKLLYDDYRHRHDSEHAVKAKDLALAIAMKVDNPNLLKQVQDAFR